MQQQQKERIFRKSTQSKRNLQTRIWKRNREQDHIERENNRSIHRLAVIKCKIDKENKQHRKLFSVKDTESSISIWSVDESIMEETEMKDVNPNVKM